MRGVNAALLGISAGALAGLSPGFANLGLGRWCQARRSAARAIPARLADGYERLQDPSIIFQQVETGTSSPSSMKLEVMLPDTRDVEVLSDLLLESFAEVLEPWMLPDSLGPVSSAWNWLVKAWEKEVIKSTLDMNHKKTMMQPSLRKPRGWQFEGESVGILLVAEGNEIVSFLELCSLPADGRTSDDALATLLMVFGGEKSARPYLQNFCVSPRWRRRGLGRTMLRLAETVVRDVWREDRLYLHAGNTEASRELYRSSGYQMTGLFQNAESLHMSKTLEPETEKEKEFAMSN